MKWRTRKRRRENNRNEEEEEARSAKNRNSKLGMTIINIRRQTRRLRYGTESDFYSFKISGFLTFFYIR